MLCVNSDQTGHAFARPRQADGVAMPGPHPPATLRTVCASCALIHLPLCALRVPAVPSSTCHSAHCVCQLCPHPTATLRNGCASCALIHLPLCALRVPAVPSSTCRSVHCVCSRGPIGLRSSGGSSGPAAGCTSHDRCRGQRQGGCCSYGKSSCWCKRTRCAPSGGSSRSIGPKGGSKHLGYLLAHCRWCACLCKWCACLQVVCVPVQVVCMPAGGVCACASGVHACRWSACLCCCSPPAGTDEKP